MNATTSTPPSRLSVIFSGDTFDGRDDAHPLISDKGGNSYLVRVRAMPARHLGRVLQLCLDEAALLEFVCQVAPATAEISKLCAPAWEPATAEWVDVLDDESHVLLVNAAQDQNFTRAASWGERQIAAKNFQAPLLMKADETMGPVVAKMVGLIVSSLKSSGSLPEPSTKS